MKIDVPNLCFPATDSTHFNTDSIELVASLRQVCIGQKAIFTCTVHGVVSYWEIKSHTSDLQFTVGALSLLKEQGRFSVQVVNSSLDENSFVRSTLSVTADEAQNGTQINCTSNDGGVESVVLHLASKLYNTNNSMSTS